MSQIFKAVSQLQAELHLLKVENLDACIRPLFVNPVTYVIKICGGFASTKNTTSGTYKGMGLGVVEPVKSYAPIQPYVAKALPA